MCVTLCDLAAVATVDGVCDGGWQSNFDNLYCFDDDDVTNDVARDTCRSRNAELASVTDDDECDYIASMMSVIHF